MFGSWLAGTYESAADTLRDPDGRTWHGWDTGRRVVAYDRAGFGQSSAYHGRLPLDFIYTECSRSLPPSTLSDAM